MHNKQRSFHYYKRNEVGILSALCGRWMIAPAHEEYLPLQKSDPENHGPEDCTSCRKKLMAAKK